MEVSCSGLESQVCAPWHPAVPVVLAVPGRTVPCLCQHRCGLAVGP